MPDNILSDLHILIYLVPITDPSFEKQIALLYPLRKMRKGYVICFSASKWGS